MLKKVEMIQILMNQLHQQDTKDYEGKSQLDVFRNFRAMLESMSEAELEKKPVSVKDVLCSMIQHEDHWIEQLLMEEAHFETYEPDDTEAIKDINTWLPYHIRTYKMLCAIDDFLEKSSITAGEASTIIEELFKPISQIMAKEVQEKVEKN